MQFLTEKEKTTFYNNAATVAKLVKDQPAAIHYLSQSLREADREVGAIRQMIDDHEEDDFGPLVHRIEEKLRELEHHLCGTDIGFANDFGAWLTKDGWKPGKECPLSDSYESPELRPAGAPW